MQFIYPGFLIGLLAIGIPVLIHLFNFRRFKKILFTNVKFLREVQQQSQKQRNLKHLLVLASRILAITALVLAFAQPYIPYKGQKANTGQKAISIYVDNSFSMNALSEKGPLLEIAKTKAREIASAYSESDKFQLLTNVFSGANDRFCSREEFLQKLDEVESDPTAKTIRDILQKQNQLLENSGLASKKAYLISDFQKAFTGVESPAPASGIEFNLIPLSGNALRNLYIDSAWFESPVFQPGQTLNLMVRIKNSGDERLEGGTVLLKLNGIQKSISGFDIAGGETKNIRMGFSVNQTGWQNAELTLTDHPVVFDDTWHFTFEMNNRLRILALYGDKPNPYLQKLFATEPYFSLENRNAEQVDYSELNTYDLIILTGVTSFSSGLSQELTQYIMQGGNLALFPSETGGNSGTETLITEIGAGMPGKLITQNTEINRLDFNNPLLSQIILNKQQNLDLPKIRKYYETGIGSLPGLTLMTMRNGAAFLNMYAKGKGNFYQFACDLSPDWSTFQQNQLFVPVLFRMALMKKNEIPLAYTIGNNAWIKPVNQIKFTQKPYLLRKGKFEIMVEKMVRNANLYLTENNQVKEAGLYVLTDNESTQPLQALAFNYNRMESAMEFSEPADLKNRFASAGVKVFDQTDLPVNTLIKQTENGTPLWRFFIGLTLLFIAIEILLLRFWKNSQTLPNPTAS